MSSLDMAKWVNEHTQPQMSLLKDSQKNKYKSRGYHFVKEQSFIYKCHNCGKTTSSVNFIKDHFPVQHKEYLKEWLQDKKPVQKMPPASKVQVHSREINHLNTKDDSLKAVAVPVSEKAIARNYLLERKISEEMMKDLWYVDNAQVLSFSKFKITENRVLGNDQNSYTIL